MQRGSISAAERTLSCTQGLMSTLLGMHLTGNPSWTLCINNVSGSDLVLVEVELIGSELLFAEDKSIGCDLVFAEVADVTVRGAAGRPRGFWTRSISDPGLIPLLISRGVSFMAVQVHTQTLCSTDYPLEIVYQDTLSIRPQRNTIPQATHTFYAVLCFT